MSLEFPKFFQISMKYAQPWSILKSVPQVLLVEAGIGEPVAAEIPLITPTLGRIPHIDWNFCTEPLENCALSQNHRLKWSRGKVVGGSGVLNTVAYVRGSKRDFDRWRDLGNPGTIFSSSNGSCI